MLKQSALRSRHRNAPRPAEKSITGYLQWLRSRPCAVAQTNPDECAGKIEAAHTYGAGDKGIGTKSNDAFAIPLCSTHHAEQHLTGWRTFERNYGLRSAPQLATEYFAHWRDRTQTGAAWKAKQSTREPGAANNGPGRY